MVKFYIVLAYSQDATFNFPDCSVRLKISVDQ